MLTRLISFSTDIKSALLVFDSFDYVGSDFVANVGRATDRTNDDPLALIKK